MPQKSHTSLLQSSVAAKCGSLCEGFAVDFVAHETVTDADLLKQAIFNRTKLDEKGCWVWTRGVDTGGYGALSLGGVTRKAHRVSYELYCGPVPKGLHVLHSCDNPACCNPSHLRAGTAKENMADRDLRGRRDVRGEQVGTAKLAEADVRDIRASELPLAQLAAIYGIDKSGIWQAAVGKSWAHLNEKYPPRIFDAQGTTVRGAEVHTAKLTENDVLAIRASKESDTVLGARYGVRRCTVWSIRSGKSWAHVTAAPNSIERA